MSDHTLRGRAVSLLSQTRTAVALTFHRRDAVVLLAVVTLGYLLAYLWAIGHLAPGLGGYDLLVVEDPLRRFFQPALGPFSFTPVARVRVGPLTYLFSLNSVVGLGLALLVGTNIALTYLAWRQPKACGIQRSSVGLVASVPALLSGTACCGPVVLFALGVQASGVLVTTFQFLLPVAAALLVVSLVLVARQFDPPGVPT
jgi:hypothetical protein